MKIKIEYENDGSYPSDNFIRIIEKLAEQLDKLQDKNKEQEQ